MLRTPFEEQQLESVDLFDFFNITESALGVRGERTEQPADELELAYAIKVRTLVDEIWTRMSSRLRFAGIPKRTINEDTSDFWGRPLTQFDLFFREGQAHLQRVFYTVRAEIGHDPVLTAAHQEAQNILDDKRQLYPRGEHRHIIEAIDGGLNHAMMVLKGYSRLALDHTLNNPFADQTPAKVRWNQNTWIVRPAFLRHAQTHMSVDLWLERLKSNGAIVKITREGKVTIKVTKDIDLANPAVVKKALCELAREYARDPVVLANSINRPMHRCPAASVPKEYVASKELFDQVIVALTDLQFGEEK